MRILEANILCTEVQRKALMFVGTELLKEGFDEKFIVGVLGNRGILVDLKVLFIIEILMISLII